MWSRFVSLANRFKQLWPERPPRGERGGGGRAFYRSEGSDRPSTQNAEGVVGLLSLGSPGFLL